LQAEKTAPSNLCESGSQSLFMVDLAGPTERRDAWRKTEERQVEQDDVEQGGAGDPQLGELVSGGGDEAETEQSGGDDAGQCIETVKSRQDVDSEAQGVVVVIGLEAASNY
jgi:hypothetical protein